MCHRGSGASRARQSSFMSLQGGESRRSNPVSGTFTNMQARFLSLRASGSEHGNLIHAPAKNSNPQILIVKTLSLW